MKPTAEFDVIIYGASGYTGRLVAEYMQKQYGAGGDVKWAMAGRSEEKLAAVRDEIGVSADVPLVVADASDPAQVKAMAERAKCICTTVGPYQLYGEPLVAACAETGTDYVDLCGEPGWMHEMIGLSRSISVFSFARRPPKKSSAARFRASKAACVPWKVNFLGAPQPALGQQCRRWRKTPRSSLY